MNKKIERIGKPAMFVAGLVLVLGSQACQDKQLAEPAPGKAIESAASTPAAERRDAGAGNESTADGSSRESAPAGGSK